MTFKNHNMSSIGNDSSITKIDEDNDSFTVNTPPSTFTFTQTTTEFRGDKLYHRIEFRNNTEVTFLRSQFSRVLLTSVRVSVIQTSYSNFNPSPSTKPTINFNSAPVFGICIAPRTMPVTETQTEPNSFARWPSLDIFQYSPNSPVTHEYNWSSGSFPPGVQLDLRAPEILFPYATILLINSDKSLGSSNMTFTVRTTFTVKCSGSNYGIAFSETV